MAFSSRSRLYLSSAKSRFISAIVMPCGSLAQKFERVSGAHGPFLLHGKIKSAAAAAQKSRENVVAVKFHSQLVTGDARLADHDDRRCRPATGRRCEDRLPVSPSVVKFSPNMPHGRLMPGQFLPPEIVVFGRIAIDGFVTGRREPRDRPGGRHQDSAFATEPGR